MRRDELNELTAAVQRAANYRGKPFPQTHPDRMATMARLYGLPAKAPEQCRVLELGCGDGGNVIPMAFGLRGSEFVGVDLDAQRIETGARWANELGLRNIKLEARDICDIGDEYGKFDYIVAHGVYCWVPAPVRKRLFDVCRSLLLPDGLATVSFNAKPGWHFLEYLRDFALLVARNGENPAPDALLKSIRGLAQLYSQEQPSEGGHAQHLKELFRRLATTSDYLLAFDYLGEISEPVSLSDFVAHAAEHELRYVGDANYFETEWRRLPKRVRGALAGLNSDVARESFADCFTGRLFRRALLCHEAAALRAPSAEQVKDFQVLGNLKPLGNGGPETSDAPASFEMLHGAKLSVSLPIVKAALSLLGEAWPSSLGFEGLLDGALKRVPSVTLESAAQLLSAAVWDMYSAGALELRWTPPNCCAVPGDRPYASALARSQLAFGDAVTNQHHDFTRLGDALSREIFARLDGKHGRAQIATELQQLLRTGKLSAAPDSVDLTALKAAVDERLAVWAKHALLCEPPA
jgi:SAM-dependent methyltransferase